MKNIFQTGDFKVHHYIVKEDDVARFQGEVVHPVCSTYALAREMEWAGRLFVLEMREETEEGIGTMVEINHLGPAFPGDELVFKSSVEAIKGNELYCAIDVHTLAGKLVAKGRTGQKILPKKVIQEIFGREDK